MIDKLKDATFKGDLRERIIITSLDAFRQNGIKSITMDDIAALLKISKRTLYEIFEDKETLLKEGICYHQQVAGRALKNLVDNSSNVLEVILKCYQGSIEMYQKVNKRFFDDIKKYPKVHNLIMESRETDTAVLVDFMKKGVDQGLFRDDINFEIIHFLLREQVDLLMAKNVIGKFPFLEVYEAIILTYLRGISTTKGVEELDEFLRKYRSGQLETDDTTPNEKTERI